MYDFFDLGSTPSDEECVQVSKNQDYLGDMKREVKRYKDYLERLFSIPEELEGDCFFSIKSNSHDFGTYYEVVIKFNDEVDLAGEFASYVEHYCPQTWDETLIPVSWDEYRNNNGY